ncbi:MAG: HlyD family efflux transporter periplasmic adaptor subunit [Gemmatimonadaceae bacterium]
MTSSTDPAELEGQPDPSFLGDDPPHWAARALAYFLILLFTTAVVATAVVHVPETVAGEFTLVPMRGADPVRAPRRGLVTGVRTAEGESVALGHPLFVIQSDPVGDRSAELGALRLQGGGSREAALNARAEYEGGRRAAEEEGRKLRARVASLTRTINGKAKQLAVARELAAKYSTGYARGAISATEYTAPQLEEARIAEELEQYEGQRAETLAAIEQLQFENAARDAAYREVQRRLDETRAQGEIRIATLERELSRSTGSEVVVPAPCAGTVLRMRINGTGAVVQDGDVLGEMACAGERLQGELIVPQSGVARVKLGQGVKLLYDAFPYQRYGVRRGRIRWISPSTMVASSGEGATFRALIDLEDDAIRAGGERRSLMAGMGGRARVVVGRRSLVSYALEPIRQLQESLAEGPTPVPPAARVTP